MERVENIQRDDEYHEGRFGYDNKGYNGFFIDDPTDIRYYDNFYRKTIDTAIKLKERFNKRNPYIVDSMQDLNDLEGLAEDTLFYIAMLQGDRESDTPPLEDFPQDDVVEQTPALSDPEDNSDKTLVTKRDPHPLSKGFTWRYDNYSIDSPEKWNLSMKVSMKLNSPSPSEIDIEPLEVGWQETTTPQGTTYRFNKEFEEAIVDAMSISEKSSKPTPPVDPVISKETSKDYFLERSLSPCVSPKVKIGMVPYTLDKDGNRHINPSKFAELCEELYDDTEEEDSKVDVLGIPDVEVTKSQWEVFIDQIHEDPEQDLLDSEPMDIDPPETTCETIPLVASIGFKPIIDEVPSFTVRSVNKDFVTQAGSRHVIRNPTWREFIEYCLRQMRDDQKCLEKFEKAYGVIYHSHPEGNYWKDRYGHHYSQEMIYGPEKEGAWTYHRLSPTRLVDKEVPLTNSEVKPLVTIQEETPSSTNSEENRRQLERNEKTLEKLREVSGITPHCGPEGVYYRDHLGRVLSEDHTPQPLGLKREISDSQIK